MCARCKFADCGIIAVGHCSDCGKGMCIAHCAVLDGLPIFTLCAACQEERRKKHEQHEVDYERRATEAEARAKQLAAALGRAEVPRMRFKQGKRMRRILGRSRLVDAPSEDRYGWLLGEYRWQVIDSGPGSSGGFYDITTKTYITAQGTIEREGGIVVRDFEGPHGLAGGHGSRAHGRAEFWEGVVRTLEQIATEHRVQS